MNGRFGEAARGIGVVSGRQLRAGSDVQHKRREAEVRCGAMRLTQRQHSGHSL